MNILKVCTVGAANYQGINREARLHFKIGWYMMIVR